MPLTPKKVNTLFYFALFHTAPEGGFWVSFPDFPECFTQGETLEETYAMAVDALAFAFQNTPLKTSQRLHSRPISPYRKELLLPLSPLT